MSQMGVYGTFSRRHAFMNGESWEGWGEAGFSVISIYLARMFLDGSREGFPAG
jgi:hypothetical protein